LALALALLKLTNTIEAKIPIIAMTINNSIKVKPCLLASIRRSGPLGRAFLFFTIIFYQLFLLKTLSACQENPDKHKNFQFSLASSEGG
jgi:hypothetical protein